MHENLLSRISGNGTTETRYTSPTAGIPRWIAILSALALDRRHDLKDQVIDLWRTELRSFFPDEIEQAILSYHETIFPSVEHIREMITDRRGHARQNNPSRKFVPCRLAGCADGYRAVSGENFARFERCECLVNHIALVKGRR